MSFEASWESRRLWKGGLVKGEKRDFNSVKSKENWGICGIGAIYFKRKWKPWERGCISSMFDLRSLWLLHGGA